MSEYPPPTENVSIFNPANFLYEVPATGTSEVPTTGTDIYLTGDLFVEQNNGIGLSDAVAGVFPNPMVITCPTQINYNYYSGQPSPNPNLLLTGSQNELLFVNSATSTAHNPAVALNDYAIVCQRSDGSTGDAPLCIAVRNTNYSAIRLSQTSLQSRIGNMTEEITNGYVKITNQTGVGTQLVAGTTAWSAVSDARLKKQVSALPSAISSIMKLNPVEFLYNTDNDTDEKRVGFIAQEVEEILPKCVLTDTDEIQTKSIAMETFIPYLVKSLQEIRAMI